MLNARATTSVRSTPTGASGSFGPPENGIGMPRLKLAIALCTCCLALLASAAAAMAVPLLVNDPGDGSDATPGDGVCEVDATAGDCTLRAAIDESNFTTGETEAIGFDEAVDLVTVATPISITAPVAIAGNGGSGPDATVISGGDLTRVFEIAADADTDLSSLVVSDGYATAGSGGGGAIRTAEGTSLDDVTVSGSSIDGSSADAFGAGVSSTNADAALSLTDSRVTGNTIAVPDALQGGGAGIAALGPLILTDSTVSDNQITNLGVAAQGGGVRADGALDVLRSTVDGNSVDGATGTGGGG